MKPILILTLPIDDAGIKKAVGALLEKFQADIKSIKSCIDCSEYWIIDRKNYFTRVCAKPHLLVFAKLNKHPVWPGKVMSINGKIANVEFFGDHTQDDIPLSKCYLFSTKFYPKSPKNKDLIEALEVILLKLSLNFSLLDQKILF